MRDRIVWSGRQEDLKRRYAVTTELSSGRVGAVRPWDALCWDDAEQALGPHGAELLRALLQTPGVEVAFVSPYHVEVSRGEAFLWQDVHPQVLAILQGQFPAPVRVEGPDSPPAGNPYGIKTPGMFGGFPSAMDLEQSMRNNILREIRLRGLKFDPPPDSPRGLGGA